MTRVASSSLLQKLFQTAAVLLIAGLFIGLGFWQLDRASALKESLKRAQSVDQTPVALTSVTQSRITLPVAAMNRKVTASGRYVANFRAPSQVDGSGKTSDWEVALLQVDEKSAIVVVIGLWSERLKSLEFPASAVIDLTGQLIDRQVEDRADSAAGAISRLDSAVLVSKTDLDLYDGYILAASESYGGIALDRTRLTPAKLHSRISGFYWQHLSYVVVWWLMALVVLGLPFYQKRLQKS